jgi:hypothetical protein
VQIYNNKKILLQGIKSRSHSLLTLIHYSSIFNIGKNAGSPRYARDDGEDVLEECRAMLAETNQILALTN